MGYGRTYWYALDYIGQRDVTGRSLVMDSGMETDINAAYNDYVAKITAEMPAN